MPHIYEANISMLILLVCYIYVDINLCFDHGNFIILCAFHKGPLQFIICQFLCQYLISKPPKCKQMHTFQTTKVQTNAHIMLKHILYVSKSEVKTQIHNGIVIYFQGCILPIHMNIKLEQKQISQFFRFSWLKP